MVHFFACTCARAFIIEFYFTPYLLFVRGCSYKHVYQILLYYLNQILGYEFFLKITKLRILEN